ESFSEIFFGNSVALGMPCLTVGAEDAESLIKAVERDPAAELSLSVRDESIEIGGERYFSGIPAGGGGGRATGRWGAARAPAGAPRARCGTTSLECDRSARRGLIPRASEWLRAKGLGFKLSQPLPPPETRRRRAKALPPDTPASLAAVNAPREFSPPRAGHAP